MLPSRFALSYIEPRNELQFDVQCAFIGLDSHQLGEDVDDNFHHDFGDNMFPYFKGNTDTNLTYSLDKGGNDDEDSAEECITFLNEEDFDRVAQYIPDSVLSYLTT